MKRRTPGCNLQPIYEVHNDTENRAHLKLNIKIQYINVQITGDFRPHPKFYSE